MRAAVAGCYLSHMKHIKTRLLVLLATRLLLLQINAASNTTQCSAYSDLYKNIDEDLQLWENTGVSEQLTVQTIDRWTNRAQEKGFAVAFLDGVAYMIDFSNFGCCTHHPSLWVAYLRAMLHLEEMFGTAIPNVEFVVHTLDRASILKVEPPKLNMPIFRFDKSSGYSDILIPNFHFYEKLYDASFLAQVPRFNTEYPWSNKSAVLFGRFTPYLRMRHPNDTSTALRGAYGQDICTSDGPTGQTCDIRSHFAEFASRFNAVSHPEHASAGTDNFATHHALGTAALNVTETDALLLSKSGPELLALANVTMDVYINGKHVSMPGHAAFKYLLHMDGQALSSRLEQLLPLGSLVFKEESGYTSFYSHLLKPNMHYLPFWDKPQKQPEDILAQLVWAQANDAAAAEIAAAGQAFALRYLNSSARACYWFTLLTRYAKLLTYVPSKATRQYRSIKTVAAFLAEDVLQYDEGKFLKQPFEP